MHQNWDKKVSSTDLVSKLQDTYVPDGIVLSESASESESELPPFTPRRHRKAASRGSRRRPSRERKKGINYKDIFSLFVKQANTSKEIAYSIVESDCACLISLNLNVKYFTSTLATRSHQRQSYF